MLNAAPLVLLAIALAAGIGMLAASIVRLAPGGPTARHAGQTWTQAALVVIGLAGMCAHAFPSSDEADERFPVADLTTIAFAGLIVLAFLLPKIKSVKIGGTEIEIQEAIKEVEKSTDLVGELLQNWMHALGIAVAEFDEERSRAGREQVLLRFLRDRLGEAKAFTADSDESDVRLAVWLFDRNRKCLRFYFSNEITDAATRTKSFALGEGMVGQAFREQRTWNESRATHLPSYAVIRGRGRPGYSAVLVTPISLHAIRIGMLSADKSKDSAFTPLAQNVLEALARMFAIVITLYQRADARAVEARALRPSSAKVRGRGTQARIPTIREPGVSARPLEEEEADGSQAPARQ